MAAHCDATKVFLPLSVVQETNAASNPHYNTRLAAKKQQQLGSNNPPSKEMEYNRHMAQLQDSNREDVQHGNGIVRSRPNVEKSQKPVKSDGSAMLSDYRKPVPGHAMRVHEYEPIPGPAEKFQNKSDKEIASKPVQCLQQSRHNFDANKDENPYNLEKESMIQVSNPPLYGVIKWIGCLSELEDNKVAGLEMVNPSGNNYTCTYFMLL